MVRVAAAAAALYTRRQAMQAGQVSAASGAQQLQQLQQGGLALATRSLQLLALPDPAEQQDFAATSGSQQQHDAGLSCITCMDVIPAAADAVRAGGGGRGSPTSEQAQAPRLTLLRQTRCLSCATHTA
jgi:hypothetical protein